MSNAKFTDLNPKWAANGGEGVTNSLTGEPIPLQHGSDIIFDCPCGCDDPLCIPVDPPLDGTPMRHARGWKRTGDDFATMTLTPSILRMDGCKWHGFITNGEIITC